MPGAVLVQIEYQSMEIMDSMDGFTPIYGTQWTYYHYIYWVERNSQTLNQLVEGSSPSGVTLDVGVICP